MKLSNTKTSFFSGAVGESCEVEPTSVKRSGNFTAAALGGALTLTVGKVYAWARAHKAKVDFSADFKESETAIGFKLHLTSIGSC